MLLPPFTKSYDGKTVLDFPGLELEPGRRYAVLGANGSGKSTLARVLAGCLAPDRGTIRPDAGVQVGYMPQKSFAFRKSVRGNLALSGAAPAEVEAMLARLGLTELAGQRAKGLSGGELARLALGRVLLRPWELLILDEPTAAMDMESAAAAETLIAEYQQKTGCTLLLVTHSIQQARRMADRVLFLHRGTLAETGPAAQVLTAPRQPETRRFLEFYSGPTQR